MMTDSDMVVGFGGIEYGGTGVEIGQIKRGFRVRPSAECLWRVVGELDGGGTWRVPLSCVFDYF